MAHATTPRTVSRAALFGPLFADSALDDVDDDAAVLTRAAEAAFRDQRRQDKRDRATSATVAAKRNDRWNGDVAEIHAHLTAHPAF